MLICFQAYLVIWRAVVAHLCVQLNARMRAIPVDLRSVHLHETDTGAFATDALAIDLTHVHWMVRLSLSTPSQGHVP